jgi:hypothetical protein
MFDDVPIFPLATNPLKPTVTGTAPNQTWVAKYTIPDPPLDNRYAMIFDSVDGSKRMRLYAPNCKVTARGDDQVQQADVESLQMTVTMYPGIIGTATNAVAERIISYGQAMDNYFT